MRACWRVFHHDAKSGTWFRTHENANIGPDCALMQDSKNGLVGSANKMVPMLLDVCTAMLCAYVSVYIYWTIHWRQYDLAMSACMNLLDLLPITGAPHID